MLEKVIELTNGYIDTMPKKSAKNMVSFLQVWKRLVLWQIYMILLLI